MIGVSNADGETPVTWWIDPTTHRGLVTISGTGEIGGSDTQVQFNDSGSFGGDAGFTYNKSTNTATLGNLVLTNALPISEGGTGSTTASAARTALGVEIGSDVQAWDADLDTWAGKTAPAGTVVGTTDTQTLSDKTLTSPVLNGGVSGTAVLDEDDMNSDSATKLATQQSIKAYADTKLAEVVEDTTPQLGGDLDAQGNDFQDVGNIDFQTGATGGTIRTGQASADKWSLQAYDVNGASYVTVAQADAGNNPTFEIFDGTFQFQNTADATKQLDLDLSGATTGTTMSIASSQTANRTLTLPDATDTLVGKTTTDTLENKTLTAPKFADGGFIADANGNEIVVFQTTASAVNELDFANAATGNGPVISTTGDDTNIDLTITPKGTGKLIVSKEAEFNETAHFDEEVDNGNSGAADTIDWTAGNKQKSTLTDDVTFTFSPEPNGPCNLVLKLVQDGTGGHTVTWPGDVKWPGGTAPTLSAGANAVDIVTFYYDGTDFYGTSSLNFS